MKKAEERSVREFWLILQVGRYACLDCGLGIFFMLGDAEILHEKQTNTPN